MYTLGYRFKPWKEAKAIADGPAIRNYICETAQEYGIDKKIRYGQKAKRAEWSGKMRDGRWTWQARRGRRRG